MSAAELSPYAPSLKGPTKGNEGKGVLKFRPIAICRSQVLVVRSESRYDSPTERKGYLCASVVLT